MLHLAGYTVDLAENGAVALARCAAVDYDLVLMDVQMPVMDGFEASRQLRATARHAATPLIAMTANVYREDRERARAAGMNDFVAKPVDPEVLFEVVGRWTGTRPRAQPLAAIAVDPQAMMRQRLASIGGFDVAAGLRSVRGNWTTYMRMLRAFAQARGGEAGTISVHLSQGRRDEALRAAHTLKGVAATLGARQVSALAADLERLLRGNAGDDGRLAPAVAQVEDACAALVASLLATLPPEEAAPAPVDLEQARAAVRELAALLAADDVRAGMYYGDHVVRIAAALGPAAQDVGRHIAAFRFDEALETLHEAERAADAGPAP
jgi:two-component system sensor histidine kinase/response regulator